MEDMINETDGLLCSTNVGIRRRTDKLQRQPTSGPSTLRVVYLRFDVEVAVAFWTPFWSLRRFLHTSWSCFIIHAVRKPDPFRG